MTHVAFLRAVNVGGKGVVKMADVVTAFEKAGCAGTTSFGHAGNLLWAQKGSAVPDAQLRTRLGTLLRTPPEVIIRTRRQMAAILEANPFGASVEDPTVKLYVVFLAKKPARIPELPVRLDKEGLELVALKGLDAFVVSRQKPGTPMYGFPNQFVEKLFGVTATSRNWSTVTKVAARMTG